MRSKVYLGCDELTKKAKKERNQVGFGITAVRQEAWRGDGKTD
jgi:hypothetical protein